MIHHLICDLNLCKYSMYVWIMWKVCYVFVHYRALRCHNDPFSKIYQVWMNFTCLSFFFSSRGLFAFIIHDDFPQEIKKKENRNVFFSLLPLSWMAEKVCIRRVSPLERSVLKGFKVLKEDFRDQKPVITLKRENIYWFDEIWQARTTQKLKEVPN